MKGFVEPAILLFVAVCLAIGITAVLVIVFGAIRVATRTAMRLVGLGGFRMVGFSCPARANEWSAGVAHGASRGGDKKDRRRGRACGEPRCGKMNPRGARFCGQCGRRL